MVKRKIYKRYKTRKKGGQHYWVDRKGRNYKSLSIPEITKILNSPERTFVKTEPGQAHGIVSGREGKHSILIYDPPSSKKVIKFHKLKKSKIGRIYNIHKGGKAMLLKKDRIMTIYPVKKISEVMKKYKR